MTTTQCTGCDQTLDLTGVFDEVRYDSDGDPWHRECYDDFVEQ